MCASTLLFLGRGPPFFFFLFTIIMLYEFTFLLLFFAIRIIFIIFSHRTVFNVMMFFRYYIFMQKERMKKLEKIQNGVDETNFSLISVV